MARKRETPRLHRSGSPLRDWASPLTYSAHGAHLPGENETYERRTLHLPGHGSAGTKDEANLRNGVVTMPKTLAVAFVLIASFCLASCSGVPNGGCVSNCTSAATVSVVLTATPPSPNSQLSVPAFTATITGISLTPSSGGSPVALTLVSPTYGAEFNRVTSDSTLLVSQSSVPAGAYNLVTVTFAAPRVTFCTQPNPGTPGCAPASLATVTGGVGSAA